VAVTFAVPAATPLTMPLELTVATAVLPLDQVTIRPVSALPLPSLGFAVNCLVAPAPKLTLAGETLTEATGTLLTVMVEPPVAFSLVAVMSAEPGATAETTPAAVTVATLVLSLDHVTLRSFS
jgi:hypothetical protein